MIATVVDQAQAGARYELVDAGIPSVHRVAHLRRLTGAARWMIAADAFVDQSLVWPAGFSVLTTEADHNGGRYAFAFAGGVWTVRRQPHGEKEGGFLQERLEGVIEHAPLAPAFARAALKVFLSIPPVGAAKLIAEHRSWDESVVITLGELLAENAAMAHIPSVELPRRTERRPLVRSAKRRVPEHEVPAHES